MPYRTETPPGPDLISDWFVQFRSSPTRELRNRLVEAHLPMADHHVARFARSAVAGTDDLRQTALIALLHAVERFDPERGASFATFAARTIDGELKRHQRDRTWTVRPPRRAQERSLMLRRSSEDLAQRLGRAPTVSELAQDVGCTTEDVLEAVEAGHARSAVGLDAHGRPGSADNGVARLLGAIDPGFEGVDRRDELDAALAGLGEKERRVLHLRFIDDLSQPAIADQVGVSQSYVSRLLRSSLEHLRHELAAV